MESVMPVLIDRRRVLATLGSGLLVAAAGCGGPKDYSQFVPPTDSARKALEAALNAWKGGRPPGRIGDNKPPVEVLDSKWKAGRQLADYQIVKEEPPAGNGPRWFTVKLTLQKPAGTQEVRYAVVGNDPLWVYSEDEYKKLSGM
jgi:hypothetical protein